MSTFVVSNPANEHVLREFTADDGESINRKVSAARTAQRAWSLLSFDKRARIVDRFKQALRENADALAMTLTNETGKPISQARGEVRATVGRIQYFLDEVRAFLRPRIAGPISFDAPDQAGTEEWVTQCPLGVIANISAWNYPYVGRCIYSRYWVMRFYTSPVTSMTGLAITRLMHEAGVPEDLFQLILGTGETGTRWSMPTLMVCSLPVHTDRYIHRQQLAGRCIPLQLELGGKDPAYVADDANVKAAAESLADGAFYNNGQSCCGIERIYVHSSVYFQFRTHFLEAVAKFKMGDPTLSDTYLGPLTRPQHASFLADQIEDAVNSGATLLTGGKAIDAPGAYFEPTVLEGVTHDMKVMREESFGPIIGLMSVSGDAEALELMNDTTYGLTASVFSTAKPRATKLLSQVNAGTVYWNCCDRVSAATPWTG